MKFRSEGTLLIPEWKENGEVQNGDPCEVQNRRKWVENGRTNGEVENGRKMVKLRTERKW